MSDKTKFIAFIELHRQKAEKIKQGVTKARSIIADHGERYTKSRGQADELTSQKAKSTLPAASWPISNPLCSLKTFRPTRCSG